MAALADPIQWVVGQITRPASGASNRPARTEPRPRIYSRKAAAMAHAALAAAATPMSIEQLAHDRGWTINQAEYRIRAGLAHDLVEVALRPTTRAGRHTYRAAKDE